MIVDIFTFSFFVSPSNFRRKFNARINEIQEQLTEVLAKASNLERTKQRLQSELDKLIDEVEKVNN